MTVTVVYDNRVYVEVDLEESRVVSVSLDESVEVDRDGTYLMENLDPPSETDVACPRIERAIEIAEDAEWPEWRSG